MSSFGNVVVVVVVVGLEPEIDQSGLHGDRRGVWLRWVRAGGDWEDEGLAWDCVRMVMRWEVRSTRYSDICQSDGKTGPTRPDPTHTRCFACV
jgi:hypothetical protein